MDGAHDLGGWQGFGAVEAEDGAVFHADWERRTFALQMLAGYERLRRDSGRVTREGMAPAAYLAASYYERWLYSAEEGMLAAGTITRDELDDWTGRLQAGEQVPEHDDPAMAARILASVVEPGPRPHPAATRFAVGDRVRVRRMRPAGHTRSPRYLRGVEGLVRCVQCEDRLPDAPGRVIEPVYAIAFGSRDVFGDGGDEPAYTIIADLWESYLEAAE